MAHNGTHCYLHMFASSLPRYLLGLLTPKHLPRCLGLFGARRPGDQRPLHEGTRRVAHEPRLGGYGRTGQGPVRSGLRAGPDRSGPADQGFIFQQVSLVCGG